MSDDPAQKRTGANIAKEMDRYDLAAAPGKSYAPTQMKLKAEWQA
jgi:hypothetical protein